MANTAKTKKYEKSAFYYALSKKDTGIIGRPIRVSDVEPGMEEQLGYTADGGNIHVAYEHEIMKSLDKNRKIALREGVNAHEALHQIFTDFVAHRRIIASYPSHERQIFATIFNCLEDAAIENFAPEVMGGTMLSSLRFSIAYIYSQSPGIDTAQNPLSQYISALIHFGDMGLVKGSWTFPEAKTVFAKTAPLFAEGIEEPNCLKRLKITKKIMEIAKPLWESVAEQQKMMEELMEELKKHMKSAANGSGRGRDADGEGEGEGGSGSGSGTSSKKKSRRNITVKKVSKEEFERMKKEAEESGSCSGSDGDGDVTVYTCDEASTDGASSGSSSASSCSTSSNKDEKGPEKKKRGRPRKNAKKEESSSENGEEKDSKNGEETNGENTSSEKSETSTGENGEKNSEETDGEKSNSDAKKSSEYSEGNDNPFVAPKADKVAYNENVATPDDFEVEEGIDEISHEEYMLTDEDIARIETETDAAINDFEKMMAEENETPNIDNFPVTSPTLGKRSCLNYRVTTNGSPSLETSYASLMSKMAPGIKTLTAQLKRIFENDQEEREYRNAGRINIKRMNSGRVTSRIFDKKRAPVGKSDFAVEILVDESGSMSGSRKDEAARNCCIALAETFNNLNIPVYIIGFTADTQGHDVVHNHYITWKNTKNERLKLLNITARANNLDGYSIRYATEVLKKRNCAHKLLIVLSDGQPAAHRYYDGVHDTKQAIRDAKKHVNVLGVAIGNSDTETIHYMYEKDFLHIGTVNDLFSGLSKTLQKMMKYWE